ncbi:MAG: PocR ligand-binding domain-containing protein [Bacteroidales bacterium]
MSFALFHIKTSGKPFNLPCLQDICTEFHWNHPESEKECNYSVQYIRKYLHEAKPAESYKCLHDLYDCRQSAKVNF